MEKFQLLPFLEIEGIGAASGVVYQNDSLFIISDNSRLLYCYNFTEKKIDKIKLFKDGPEVVPKKDKPDFESITLFDNQLSVFGSGSTRKRNIKVVYDPATKAIKEESLFEVYQKLIASISIADNDLNIEGVIVTAKITYFFQRGNGFNALNGVFCYNEKDKTVEFKSIPLPKINNVPATFTDAILVDDTIYFLAAAENTTSTYDDGAIEGSLIGTINLKTLELETCLQISDKHKFEGVTLYKKTAMQIEFLICEDNDTEELATTVYKLVIRK